MKTGTISNNKPILRKLFINAFFVMCFLEVMNSAASLIDSFFMGNYIGSAGIAAMGYARPFFSFSDILCGPLGLGMQLVCARYIGKSDVNRAQKVFSGALTVGLAVSLILAAGGLFFSGSIVFSYGTDSNMKDVLPLAERYIQALFLCFPARILFGILSPIVQLGNGKRLISISILVQVAADIAGDACSTLLFDGGAFGLGLATAVSMYLSLVPLLLYFFRKDAILSLRFSRLSRQDLKDIFKAGRAKAIKRVCNTVKPIILNSLSVLLGTSLALSAFSITTQLRDLLISFSAGVSGAAVLIGALLYSQRDRKGLECIAGFAIRANLLITVLCAVCFAFAQPIAGLFVDDSPEVIRMAATSIRCVGIMIPFSTFNGTFIAYMQITERYGLVNFLSYMNRLILIVLCSVSLGLLFGIDGLWWAFPVSEILNMILSLIVVRIKSGKLPKAPIDLLCLPPDFGYRPEDYIELSLKSADEVVSLLDSAKTFCQRHGIDTKRCLFVQIALEELSMNVISHGFPKSRLKDPSIHVWILYDKGNLYLRFQDNCPRYNVMKHCAELQKESAERCVGLRLIAGISKEMKYVNTLNTNNLIITV